MIDRNELSAMLKAGDYSVTFTKVDGTERVMKCTLREQALPQSDTVSINSKSDSVISVWDLEKNSWRSFRLDSVKSVEPM
jgi:hypothetical protein